MDQNFRAKPFRFDTEFAFAPPPPQAADATPVTAETLEIAALRAEMEALRADHARALDHARNQGFLDGMAQARAEREQALLAAADALHAEWEDFADHRDAMVDQLRGEASRLARAVGEVLAARALAQAPVETIDQAIGRVLAQIARGQEVLIAVHPDLVAETEARIALRQAQDRRRLNLIVQGDATLPPGDARLRWEGGGLSLDAARRARAVQAEMEALGVEDAPETPPTSGPEDVPQDDPDTGGIAIDRPVEASPDPRPNRATDDDRT